MFIATLSIIARTWKQPKCPMTDEWMKKMWYIYTMEYYSALKRNKIELFVVRWKDVESVIQSEISQKEKNEYHILMHICVGRMTGGGGGAKGTKDPRKAVCC